MVTKTKQYIHIPLLSRNARCESCFIQGTFFMQALGRTVIFCVKHFDNFDMGW